jgi:filamentous hemagglutinin
MPAITIDERRTSHIFRDAEGHFREDTSVNRRALVQVANRPTNLVGTDRFGNSWFAETRTDVRKSGRKFAKISSSMAA